jgi:hypothetical protein
MCDDPDMTEEELDDLWEKGLPVDVVFSPNLRLVASRRDACNLVVTRKGACVLQLSSNPTLISVYPM